MIQENFDYVNIILFSVFLIPTVITHFHSSSKISKVDSPKLIDCFQDCKMTESVKS